MSKSTELVVKITSDTKQAVSGVDGLGSKVGGMGKKMAGLAAGGVVALGAAIGAMAVSGVKDAANLEQSIGAIDSVFKKNADQMHTWSKTAATDVGLTRNEFNELGTLIGAQLKNGGTAMDQLAPKTKSLITTGADLASMFGGSTKDAVAALSSALKGERDPIEKYGVSLNQAKIDAEAAALGFKKTKDGLSGQATQAATLSLIMKQTADAQGNFAREGDTLAHQQQVLSATFTDLKTQLGTALLPIINTVFTFLNTTAVPAVKALFASFQGGGGGGLAAIIAKLGLTELVASLQRVGAVIAVAVTTHWPAIRAALLSVIPHVQSAAANVIALATAIADRVGPVITALAPVVTTVFGVIMKVIGAALGVISAIIRTVTAVIRGDWSAAWDGVKSIVAATWNLIKTVVLGAISVTRSYIAAFGPAIIGLFGKAKDGIVSLWRRAWDAIKSAAVTGAGNLVAYVKGIPSRITGALGDLGGLLKRAGVAIISGFLGGLKEKYEDVKNFVGGIASWIADHKGPLSYDRRLLQPAGAAIMGGFIKTLRAAMPELRATVADITKTAAGVTVPKFGTSSAARFVTSARGGRAGDVYQITIQGAVDPVGTARQIDSLMRARGVRSGRVVLAGGPR